MTEVYDNIRAMREKQNLTQEEMADKLHMSTSGYAKIEQGKTKLFHEKLEHIAEVFGISIYQLMPPNSDINISVTDNNSNYNMLCYVDNNAEIEKLQLSLKYKDELLRQKDNENNALKEIIELLKNNK
ncbi:MAG: helix-turn-helix transcriptional regulator [Moraxellaceae bacterium]|nr:helix-turn-helix transcriptional regulator [Moraxellaceae bacterium]